MILIFRTQVDKQIVVKLNLLQTSLVVLLDDERLLAIHFQALNFGYMFVLLMCTISSVKRIYCNLILTFR
mgnify:FL=1